MKATITISLLLLCMAGVGQEPQFRNIEEPVITDSIIWRVVSVLNIGDVKCNHEWVYSDTWAKGDGISCLVNHRGFHCSWNDKERYAVCRICKRKEHQKEQWYQHRKEHVPSEYEITDSDSGEYKINDNNTIRIDTLKYGGPKLYPIYGVDSIYYKLPKDTLIQQSRYIWYNEAKLIYIDSTQHYMTMHLIVNLWDEYKQECWNDSTGYPCHRSGSPYMNLSYGYSTCYIHKDPTLEGFMEFIRRRGK